jgi:hypothetical protein
MKMAKSQESTSTAGNGTETAGEAPKGAPKRGSQVESTFADKWDPRNPGDAIQGRYLGYEVAENGRDGSFNAYQLQDDNGKRVSMAGAHLDSILPQVPQNTYVWIEFTGLRAVGRNQMKVFKVDVEEGVKLIPVLK